MRVIFSAQSKAALREIALFIGRDSKTRALAFVDELRVAARKLDRMPRAFPLVVGYEAIGIRSRSFGDYLIFYRITEDRILIVDIIHGARDYEAILFTPE